MSSIGYGDGGGGEIISSQRLSAIVDRSQELGVDAGRGDDAVLGEAREKKLKIDPEACKVEKRRAEDVYRDSDRARENMERDLDLGITLNEAGLSPLLLPRPAVLPALARRRAAAEAQASGPPPRLRWRFRGGAVAGRKGGKGRKRGVGKPKLAPEHQRDVHDDVRGSEGVLRIRKNGIFVRDV